MSQIIFIVEGETEKKLTNTLYLGKVTIANLWNLDPKKIDSILRLIPRKETKVFIVCDTDCIDLIKRERFIKNFHSIKSHIGKDNIFLFQQNLNLEDELLYCLNINNIKGLYSLFNNASGTGEFKRNFINEKNLSAKLVNNNFDSSKLWSSPLCPDLSRLQEFYASPKDFSPMISRKIR